MKKKIVFATAALSILIAGVVSAASLWGTYKGNDIIRLTVDGDPVKVTDVPAINYNNRTMIPIYLLQQAGIQYNWDQQNRTVNVIKPLPEKETVTVSVPVGVDYHSAYNNLKSIGVTRIFSEAKYLNGQDIDYVAVDYKGLPSSMSDNVLSAIITELGYSSSTHLFIGFLDGSSYGMTFYDIKQWMNGKITGNEMSNRIEFYPSATNNSSTSTQTQPSPVTADCSSINRKYDQQKRTTEEQYGAAGMGRSSALNDALKEIENNRTTELSANGCTP